MRDGDAIGEPAPGYRGEADVSQYRTQLIRRRKQSDGFGKVGIGET